MLEYINSVDSAIFHTYSELLDGSSINCQIQQYPSQTSTAYTRIWINSYVSADCFHVKLRCVYFHGEKIILTKCWITHITGLFTQVLLPCIGISQIPFLTLAFRPVNFWCFRRCCGQPLFIYTWYTWYKRRKSILMALGVALNYILFSQKGGVHGNCSAWNCNKSITGSKMLRPITWNGWKHKDR